MLIQLKAYVDRTKDNGMEFYDRLGAVVVRVDGETLAQDPSAVRLTKISEADEFHAPLYSVELDPSLEVSVQAWSIGSVQLGKVSDLIHDDEI